MIFPVLCPACHADSGARIIPASPEVETFACGDCRHQWSEPLRTDTPSQPLNVEVERRWRLLFQPNA